MEELGPSDMRLPDHVDLGDDRRVERENPFDADTIADFANGKRRARARAAPGRENHAFKNLDALFFAFLDFLVDADGLTGFELWECVGHRV